MCAPIDTTTPLSGSNVPEAPAAIEEQVARLQSKIALFTTIGNLGKIINSTLDEREIRNRAIEAATSLAGSQTASLLLLDGKTGELYFDVALGEAGAKVKQVRLKSGEGIAGWVAQTGKAQVINDVQADPRFMREADKKSGFTTRNMICVPVEIKGKRVGVLQAINKEGDGGRFGEKDLEGLLALADQVAIALDNANLYRELKETFLETAAALGDAIEAKDAYTAGHTRRVMEYSTLIGARLGISGEYMEQMRFAAVLHDIGKIGIPDAILGKPGRLDPDEWRVMKTHAAIGGRIVSRIQTLNPIAEGVRHHHERYDGTGYPDRLQGEAIPLMARVIAVCDTFDAMTSHRPYRLGLPVENALSELSKQSGTQFDPLVTNAFLSAYQEGEITPIYQAYLTQQAAQ